MKRWRVVLLACGALSLYLVMEAFLPPASQPSAKLGVALLHAYQATGSKVVQAGGIHCRYTPSCSHYAEDAITYRGTLNGLAMTVGRLWRCAPWGGSGYDPAVETHSAAYVAPEPQEESPDTKRQREKAEKEMKEAIDKMTKEAGPACLAGTIGCVIVIITSLAALAVHIFMMVYAYKDSTARGDANGVLWLVLIFFFPLVGFIVYMIARPKGDLVPCPNCKQQKLSVLMKCPHCAADLGGGAAPKA
jgi:uncharacterized protein